MKNNRLNYIMKDITMKIGVISDTHHRGSRYLLPASIKTAFAKVDLIIHAGDIIYPSVIQELEKIAPVKAIRGNKKEDKHNFKKMLPSEIVFDIKGIRFAVIHCLKSRIKKEISHGLNLMGWQTLSDHLLVREIFSYFKNHGKIDCIIFGDTHKPFCKKVKGVLFLNPGAAYPTTKRPGSVLILEINNKSSSIIPKLIYFSLDLNKSKAIQI